MGVVLADNCLREAGAGGSNPLTPTIFRCKQAILVDHSLFEFFSEMKLGARYTHLRAEDLMARFG